MQQKQVEHTAIELPYASVIVPAYNAENMIKECIESLLNLDYPEEKLEIIIVDNKSTDRTKDIVSTYPITLLEETEVQGSYAARNKGIKRSAGEILAFTDSDCIVDKNWLKCLVYEITREQSIGGTTGKILAHEPKSYIDHYQANSLFSTSRYAEKREITLKKRGQGDAPTANACYKKDVFNSVGLFDDRMVAGGDREFAHQVLAQSDYRIIYCPEAVVFHRHPTSLAKMFKRSIRYGFIGGWISEQESETFNRGAYSIPSKVKEMVRITAGVFVRLIKTLFRKKNMYDVAELLFSSVELCGETYGLLRWKCSRESFKSKVARF